MIYSRWTYSDFCEGCDKQLSHYQKFYSNGVCPLCGEESNSTIVDTYTLVYRFKRPGPWWKFWQTWETEYKI